MNAMNPMEAMTIEKGMMPKMENSMEFTPTMSMPVMPMMSRNGTNMNLGRDKFPWNRIDQAARVECAALPVRLLVSLNEPMRSYRKLEM